MRPAVPFNMGPRRHQPNQLVDSRRRCLAPAAERPTGQCESDEGAQLINGSSRVRSFDAKAERMSGRVEEGGRHNRHEARGRRESALQGSVVLCAAPMAGNDS